MGNKKRQSFSPLALSAGHELEATRDKELNWNWLFEWKYGSTAHGPTL
jgi:hypothetical protein